VRRYASVAGDLYDAILNRCVAPGTVCMRDIMMMDAKAGAQGMHGMGHEGMAGMAGMEHGPGAGMQHEGAAGHGGHGAHDMHTGKPD
jgi:cytochrome o ubiquinol oxidase subunit 2